MKKYLLIPFSILLCCFYFQGFAQYPKFVWANQIGGIENDGVGFISLDASNNILIEGSFNGAVDFGISSGTFILNGNNNANLFYAKYDNSRNLIWAKQIGGSGIIDNEFTIQDKDGNIYSTGELIGTIDFDPGPNTFNLTAVDDIFISKFSSSGDLIWAKQFPGGTFNRGLSIAIDATGNIYTTGFFQGTVDFDPSPNTFKLTANHYDVFVSKLDPSGNFIWAKHFGGIGQNIGESIATDNLGNVYVSGSFEGNFDFDPGPGINKLQAKGVDCFISKFDGTGNLVWVKQFGGTGAEGIRSMCIDINNNLYFAGVFNSKTDFDPGAGVFELTPNGFDIFILKLDASGNFNYAKKFGGTGDEAGSQGILVDNQGNVYSKGTFENSIEFNNNIGTFCLTSNLLNPSNGEAFMFKLDPIGNFEWAIKSGLQGEYLSKSFALNSSNEIVLAGAFYKIIDFDPGQANHSLTSIGKNDAFILKLSQDASEFPENDCLVPSVNSFYCTNQITDHPGLSENYEFYSDNTPYSNNDQPIKICSDGSAATIFKINATNTSGINFQLVDQNDHIVVSTFNSFSENIDKYGNLSIPISKEPNTIEVYYTHPQYMEIENQTYRQLILKVLYGNQPIENVKFPVRIYRAPLLFVHGLWGDKKAFYEYEYSLIKDHIYPGELKQITISRGGFSPPNYIINDKTDFLINRLDYSYSNASSFNSNEGVLLVGRNDLFNKLRMNGFSFSKMIVIGHSMGGILARSYLQGNHYRNDVQKLITLNSPHYGSEMANYLLWKPTTKHPDWPDNNNLREALNKMGRYTNKGAVNDLQVMSEAINKLNILQQFQKKVPSAVISTREDENYIQAGDVCRWINLIAGNAFNKHKIFNKKNNDNIVSVRSQNSDLDDDNYNLDNQCHGGSPSNTDVQKLITELINSNSFDNKEFSLDGFKPGSLLEPIPKKSISGQVAFNIKNQNNNPKCLNFTTPINHQEFNAGDVISVNIQGSNDIKSIILLIGNDKINPSGFYSDSSHLICSYLIPNEAYGNINLVALANDTSEFKCIDTISINIKSLTSIDSLFCDPDSISIAVGYTASIKIYGLFSDGIIKDVSFIDDLKYEIDSLLLNNLGHGFFRGNKSGDNIVKVKYLKNTASFKAHIYLDTSLFIGNFNSDKRNICVGSKVNYQNESTGNPVNYHWLFPGGVPSSSIDINPSILYNSPGSYEVTLITTYPGKIDSLTIKDYIRVDPYPIVNFGQQNTNSPVVIGSCSATLDAGNPGASYLWNTGETTQMITVYKTGTYSVMVTNPSGCSAMGYVFANITDNIKPKALIQNTFAYLDGTGKVEITPEMINKGSSDNCGISSISVNPKLFTCKNKGANKVILTVSDANGNSSTASAIVNVIDLEPPKIICPPDISVNLPEGQCNIYASSINLGSPVSVYDNCALKFPATNNKSKTIYSVGENYVTWTISDSSNNAGTCIQKIIVQPTCGSPKKVTCSDSTSISAKIKWQAVSCAIGYELRIKQELFPGVWTPFSGWSNATGPGLLHMFTGLKANKYYSFQIRTKCGISYSQSVVGYFHTKPGLNSGDSQNRNSERLEILTESPSKIFLIPNPAIGFASIIMEGFENNSKNIVMYDLEGKLIFKVELKAKDNQLEFDLKTLNVHSGIYFVRVSDSKKQKTEQLLIER